MSKDQALELRQMEVTDATIIPPDRSKEGVFAMLNRIEKEVIEGTRNPLQAYDVAKQIEKALNTLKANIEPVVKDKIEEYDGAAEHFGKTFSIRNGGVSFNYKQIPEWIEADAHKKAIEGKYKAMYEAKQRGAAHANVSEDGEILPLPTPVYRKSSIQIK